MRILLVVAFMVYASVAMAEDKRKDDEIKPFRPSQETIKVMDHVFEVLR